MLEGFKNIVIVGLTCLVGLVLLCFIWLGISAVYSKYSVWDRSNAGQAQLAEADYNRQIAVREAKAKEESASLLAKAEVIRARGVAKANKIIGQSLNKNEAYLRYLWIENLQNEHNQVIYVPTEANLPILEANRLSNHKVKQ